MAELSCAALVLGPSIVLIVGVLAACRRARIGSVVAGLVTGIVAGAYLVGLGELAFAHSLSCIAAGLLFEIHTAVFAVTMAGVAQLTPWKETITRMVFSNSALGWQWAFWLLVYGGCGGLAGYAWRRRKQRPGAG